MSSGKTWEYIGGNYFQDAVTGQRVYKPGKANGAVVGQLYNMGTTNTGATPDPDDYKGLPYNQVPTLKDYRERTGLEGLASEEAYYFFLKDIGQDYLTTATVNGDIPNYSPPNEYVYDGGLRFGGGDRIWRAGDVIRTGNRNVPGSVYDGWDGDLLSGDRPVYDGGGPGGNFDWADREIPEGDNGGSANFGGGRQNMGWDWANRPNYGTGIQPASPVDWKADIRPGTGSPWGIQGPGGNSEFYAQQLNNQLAADSSWRESAIAAALRGQNQAPSNMDNIWGWAYGGEGLPEVQVPGQSGWQLNSKYNTGMTNSEAIARHLQGWTGSGDSERIKFLESQMQRPGNMSQNNWLTSTTGPQKYIDQISGGSLTPENYGYLRDVFTDIYRETGGYSGPGEVPAGYAAPIQWG